MFISENGESFQIADVNAPALAEYVYHRKEGNSSCAYITVGTGVGVGLVVNGNTVHCAMHPEGGHISVPKKLSDNFAGSCPFHGSCIEGMCSSGALAARKGVSVHQLPHLLDEDPVWDICAYQLAHLCANLVLMVSPERIVLGGGVMNRTSLFPKIRVRIGADYYAKSVNFLTC